MDSSSIVVVGEIGRNTCSPQDMQGRDMVNLHFPGCHRIFLKDFRVETRRDRLLTFIRERYDTLSAVCLLGTDTWELVLPYIVNFSGDRASGRLNVQWFWGHKETFVLKVDSGWNLAPLVRQHRLHAVANWFELECRIRRAAL